MRSPQVARRSAHPVGHGIAILIGINEYQAGIPPLANAVRDVKSVAQVLAEEHDYEVCLLVDVEATLAGLRSLLSALPQKLAADDRLVFYFAGHGIAEDTEADGAGPQGYLIPQDAKRDDPTTFLPMAEVQAVLSKLPCKHLLLLLDCCFAGAFRWSQTRSLRVRPATLFRERYERYLRDPAWQVMASAAADERALDVIAGGRLGSRGPDSGNSPFAAALCQGLRGAADLRIDGQPGDGVIVAHELHLYVESAFERLEQQLKRALQKPLLWSLEGRDKGQFIFFTPGRTIALPSALELVEANNPYRGLEPYDEKNAALFFGRGAVVEQLEARVLAQRLTVVSGVSGSGKSSVVRAGLVSRLRAEGWFILPLVRPGARPLGALLPVLSALGSAESVDLVAAISAWRARHAQPPLLLVIDQVEELVTMGASAEERGRFLQIIQRALAEHPVALHVVMTLRSDFEPHFSELLSLSSESSVRFPVRPLDRKELRQVIEGPASERVLYFEPASLVDQIIDDVAEMPGALPLLSFTMSELYRLYVSSGRGDRCLTSADYQKLGGVAGALSQRADEIRHSLDAEQKDTLRRVMLRMVALEAGEVARRRVPLTELHYGEGHPEQSRVQAVLARMQEARLIVSGQDSDGAAYAEPAHDKLVLGWPQVWSFIRQEQDTIPLHRLLTQEADTWARLQRPSDHLWAANPRLPLALELQQQTPLRFNACESDFIRASQRRRVRQRGLLIAGVSLVIAALSALAVWALDSRDKAQKLAQAEKQARTQAQQQERLAREAQLQERRQKERAEEQTREATAQRARAEKEQARAEEQTRRADAEAVEIKRQLLATYVEQGRQLLLAGDSPEQALLWLHRAYQEGSSDPQLPLLLHDAMRVVDGVSAILVGHTGGVYSATYSPDGQRILTTSEDKTARVWDARSGRLVYDLGCLGLNPMAATYSPDGLRIVAWGNHVGCSGFWEAATGRHLGRLGQRARRFIRRSGGLIVGLVWREPSAAEEQGGSAAYTPDGRRIVTASAAGRVVDLWDAESGLLLTSLANERSPVHRGTISPDGRRVVIGYYSGAAAVFETESGRRVLDIKGHQQQLHSVVFSPDGQRILTASADHTARLWDAQTGQPLLLLSGHQGPIHIAAYRPDGRHIVTASEDHTARIWAADTGLQIRELKGHSDSVWDAAYSQDGKRIVTASAGRSARVFDADSGSAAARFSGHTDVVYRAAFSPDGQHVVTASADKTSRIFALDAGRFGAKVLARAKSFLRTAQAPDARRLAVVQGDRVVQIWDANSALLITELGGHTAAISQLAYSPDGRRIVTASEDRTARIWDTASGRLIAVLPEHGGAITAVQYSPDGRRIATMATDRMGRIWESDTGRPVSELTRQPTEFSSIEWSPDSRQLLTAGQRGDESVRLWDASSGRLISEFPWGEGTLMHVGFVDDGQRILAQGAWAALIWHRESCKLVAAVRGSGFDRNPDLRTVAVAGGGSSSNIAEIRDFASGRILRTLKGHRAEILSMKHSPDGRRLVTSSNDKIARLWETHTGRLLAQLSGHTGHFLPTFSPEGRYLITTSSQSDHTARIWDGRTGRLIAIVPAPYQELKPTFSPAGDSVVLAGDDHTLRVWELRSGRLLSILRGEPGRLVWAAYSPDGSHFFSMSEHGTLQVWDVGRETRSADEIGKRLRCSLSFRFERAGSTAIVATTPNPRECSGLPAPPPNPAAPPPALDPRP